MISHLARVLAFPPHPTFRLPSPSNPFLDKSPGLFIPRFAAALRHPTLPLMHGVRVPTPEVGALCAPSSPGLCSQQWGKKLGGERDKAVELRAPAPVSTQMCFISPQCPQHPTCVSDTPIAGTCFALRQLLSLLLLFFLLRHADGAAPLGRSYGNRTSSTAYGMASLMRREPREDKGVK